MGSLKRGGGAITPLQTMSLGTGLPFFNNEFLKILLSLQNKNTLLNNSKTFSIFNSSEKMSHIDLYLYPSKKKKKCVQCIWTTPHKNQVSFVRIMLQKWFAWIFFQHNQPRAWIILCFAHCSRVKVWQKLEKCKLEQ